MLNTDKLETCSAKATQVKTDLGKAPSVKWQKVPSVSGPKAYFYNTICGDYYDKRTVVWDFFCKCWVVKGPQTLEDKWGKAYMTFDSVAEAKAYVEAGKAV